MRTLPRNPNVLSAAFTLLEVIIACALFFMVGFAVLELVTRGLAMARSLQQREPSPGVLAAVAATQTRLEEGSSSGDFEDLVGNLYDGYSWGAETNEVGSNSLFQVDFIVYPEGKDRR